MNSKTLALLLGGSSSSVLAYKFLRNNDTLKADNSKTKVDKDCTKLGQLVFNSFPQNSEINSNKKEQSEPAEIASVALRHPQVKSHTLKYNKKYKHLVPKLFNTLHQIKEETGSPGISFSISLDGDLVMKGGIGLADVENGTLMTSETILRIASISKSLTSIAVGRLVQEGKLDIEKPIQSYLKEFKPKTFKGKPVSITTAHLLSHTSGIRGYFDDPSKESEDDQAKIKKNILLSKMGEEKSKTEWDENYISKHYDSVEDGLALFIDDPLIYEPGKGSEYSSVAYSLVSRILEESSGKDYITIMTSICQDLGMENTRVDLNEPIILNRGRYYKRSEKNHRLLNVPYVDNSYKWSGGGFLSNTEDLVVFGNEMLKSYQSEDGVLNSGTVRTLWQPVTNLGKEKSQYHYALGWDVSSPLERAKGNYTAGHTGGAIGVSSILQITPQVELSSQNKSHKQVSDDVTVECKGEQKPQGSVIALIVNMQNISLTKTAERLRHILDEK